MADPLTDESLVLSTLLNDPTVSIVAHLGKTTIDLEQGNYVLSDIIECDFPGYAPVAPVTFDAFQLPDPIQGEAVSQPIRFTAGAIVTPQAATCAYITVQKQGEAAVLWQLFPLLNEWIFDFAGRSYAFALRVRSLSESFTPTFVEAV